MILRGAGAAIAGGFMTMAADPTIVDRILGGALAGAKPAGPGAGGGGADGSARNAAMLKLPSSVS